MKGEINIMSDDIALFHNEVANIAIKYNIDAYYLESGDGMISSKVDGSRVTHIDSLLKETMENRIDTEVHKNPEPISTFA